MRLRLVSRIVTIGVVLAVIAVVVLLIRARIPSTTVGGEFRTYAKFRDASRLASGSPVVIAGVRIGDITRLTIEGRLGRVDMRLREGLQLPVDSFATRRADSLFGDSYIEIVPGESNIMLRSGEPIAHVEEGGSTDSTLRNMERALPKIENALDLVHETMVDGRKVVAGPGVERVEAADRWLAEGHIEDPISTADHAMIRVEDATTRGAQALRDADIQARLNRIDDAAASARKRLTEINQSMVQGFRDARAGLDRIDPTVDQMAEVMSAINESRGNDWKGTLGTLVNDPELGESIEDAADAGAEAVHSFNRFKSWLGVTFEANPIDFTTRFYATAEIYARTDKFYLVEFEKSDEGGIPNDTLTDAPGTGAYTRTQQIHDRIRYTAQFGKQFAAGHLQVRAGLKESTFGIGADALFLRGRLRLSTDVFGSVQPVPRVKLAGAFAVFRSIYVLAGVDDALNKPHNLQIITGNTDVPTLFDKVHYGRNYFIGASMHFDDADLATLLRIYGALLVAAVGS